MLSVIITARNEIYLQRTIDDVLSNAEGDIEVVVVEDGYTSEPALRPDPRVVVIHHDEPHGQRQSINEAVAISRGEYMMKLDAHCAVDKGFDVKLAQDCEYDWTVVPRMYNLDVQTWKPKLHKRTDYMYIGMNEKNQLRSLYYSGREWKRWHRREELIDDTMGCMGPGWFMHKKRFLELGGCDEAHGSWGSQGIEVACKAWLSGGSLKVNKKTWFAHWFRGSDGGFPYPLPQRDIDKAREHSEDLWLNNKWDKQVRKFDWLIEKFNPPSWGNKMEQNKIDDLNTLFYKHIHLRKKDCAWKGVRAIKMPTDLLLYHEVIWENKPDFIIDSGTKFGGSALFFQDMLDMNGKGQVISIDKYPVDKVKDPRIIYLEGSSTHPDILAKVKELVGDKTVMVVLDSDHSRINVKRELHRYAPIVTKGQYMVVEDCYMYKTGECRLDGPGEARDWFLSVNRGFVQTNLDQQYLIGFTRGGWLKKA